MAMCPAVAAAGTWRLGRGPWLRPQGRPAPRSRFAYLHRGHAGDADEIAARAKSGQPPLDAKGDGSQRPRGAVSSSRGRGFGPDGPGRTRCDAYGLSTDREPPRAPRRRPNRGVVTPTSHPVRGSRGAPPAWAPTARRRSPRGAQTILRRSRASTAQPARRGHRARLLARSGDRAREPLRIAKLALGERCRPGRTHRMLAAWAAERVGVCPPIGTQGGRSPWSVRDCSIARPTP